MQGRAVPLSYISGGLAVTLHRAVVDKTNLKGLYDFKLQWTPDPIMSGAAAPGGPTTEPLGAFDFYRNTRTARLEARGLEGASGSARH